MKFKTFELMFAVRNIYTHFVRGIPTKKQNRSTEPRDVRNSKPENMTRSGENGLNIRTNASPK